MRQWKKLSMVLAVAAALGALAPARAAASPVVGLVLAVDDPLGGLTNMVVSLAKNWAAALVIVGFLVAGGAIILGSAHAGSHVRNLVMGAVILAMVALGKGLYDLWAGWVSARGGP